MEDKKRFFRSFCLAAGLSAVSLCAGEPVPRTEISIFNNEFNRSTLRRNKFDERAPSPFLEYRSPVAPKKPVGGIFAEKGRKFLRLPAAPDGFWGWCSVESPLPEPRRNMTLNFQYRISGDFSGNIPEGRLVFRRKGRDIMGRQISIQLPVPEKNVWLSQSCSIPATRIPKEADGFQIAVQTGRRGTDPVAGNIDFRLAKLTVPEKDGNAAKIKSSRDLNWFESGESVCFKAEGTLPAGTREVLGKVTRSDRSPVAEIKVSADAMKQTGWFFRPEQPGYYEVRFFAETSGGSVPLDVEYAERARNGTIRLFSSDCHSFAVLEGKNRTVSELFGYQTFFHPWKIKTHGDQDFRAAKAAGGRYMRFGADWDQLEPRKGQFDWTLVDRYIELCGKNGLQPFIGLSGTPRWASSHPEDNRWVVCKWGYSAWAPKDLRDWENFIEKLVTRYRTRVKHWEIWNEPNLPGVSCFWHDTPENFVKLMESAYRTVKRVQPEAEVLGSGYTDHYLPFYERIGQLGGGKYFDIMTIHGLNCTIPLFQAVDRKYRSPKHRVFSSEWHWGLLRHDYSSMNSTEEELSLGMMKSLFSMIDRGVEGIIVFEPINMAEKETLRHHAVGSDPLVHTSGMFHLKPRLQPRLPAVVMANLYRNFMGGLPKVKGMYRHGACKSVLFSTANGPFLAFWTEAKNKTTPAPELAKAVSSAVVRDWENRPVNHPVTMTPQVVYFAENPAVPADWKTDSSILGEDEESKVLNHDVKGVYSAKPILKEKTLDLLPGVSWNGNLKLRLSGAPANFKKPTRFAVAFTPARFQMIVETSDLGHHQEETGRNLWRGDSIEFALDIRGKGLKADRFGFSAAKIPGGRDLLLKNSAPSVLGDCPAVWTPAYMPVETGSVKVELLPGKTVYKIDIPVTEFYPHPPKPGQVVRFSLLVNDNDGRDRTACARWGHGIVDGQDSTKFGDLLPLP